MAEFPALPLFTDALLADTEHLSEEEFGAYIKLLIIIWRNSNCKIPNDDAWIMRRLRADEAKYNRLYKPLIKEFLQSDGNFITQKRLLKEFEYLRKVRGQKSVNAKSRWDKEKPESKRKTPHPTPPAAEANTSAIDFKKVIFDEGLRWLSSQGNRTPTTMRTMLGKWCRDYGDAAVAAALVKGQKFSPVDPISYIEGELKNGNSTGKSNTAFTRPNKTERAQAAIRAAAESGGFAPGHSGETKAGDDDIPEFPGFKDLR